MNIQRETWSNFSTAQSLYALMEVNSTVFTKFLLPQKTICVVQKTPGKQATGRTNHNLMEAGEAARQAENHALQKPM